MKGLPTLIRLHRWQLDEKRRIVVDLERLKDDLEGQAAQMERELRSESRLAGDDDLRFAYSSYARATEERRRTLARSIAELDAQITAAREEVAGAFETMKKYELIDRQRTERGRQSAQRRQQAELDAVALQIYQRNKAGGG